MNRPESHARGRAAEAGGLDALGFDNRFVRELPGDVESANRRRQVVDACHSRVAPTPVAAPRLVAYAHEVAALLDLTPADCETPLFSEVFAGNRLLAGMAPYATCYGGHQFGNWAGQLGDGRAINLGEVVNRRHERWALQLKGAGPTPYSRSADGLAVLRSSVREFLCSEAMHHLGVPTTRALSLVTTGESVVRDMFYDGNPRPEPGAVVCRVAPSFTRFGHFEIHAARGHLDTLKRLLDYTIRTDFSGFDLPADGSLERSRPVYLAWFEEVCRRTAALMVAWMRVGFVHGVMNTDNMSILGLTIDYGPYGWLEDYDPDWTPNTTDAHGRRYRYGQQPQVALWNLVQLANALYPLIGDAAPLEQALESYRAAYAGGFDDMIAAKLGLPRLADAADRALVDALFELLASVETDMTLFFRQLARVALPHAPRAAPPDELAPAWYVPNQLDDAYRTRLSDWLAQYAARLSAAGVDERTRRQRMDAVNPRYVLRNYLAQLAIDRAEQGDASGVAELLEVLRHPYDEQPGMERYAARRPDWARHRAGCSMLSCSS